MSTLEDAQAFLRFIIATRLRSPADQPHAGPRESGALSAEGEAQDMPAVTDRHLLPQKGTGTGSGVCTDSHPVLNTICLHPPQSEATRTQKISSEKAEGTLHGDHGPHVVTNLYLYPIKSCAAFEVRAFTAAQKLLLFA